MSINASNAIAMIQRFHSNRRWKSLLKDCEKEIAQPIKKLSTEQKREIKDFYSRFGFKSVDTRYHQYIYSITDCFSPKYLPEDFFHGVLENTYNCRGFYAAWEDKAFMPYILDCVRFPETICCNVNGIFFDKNRKIISQKDAEKLIADSGDLFAKPTLASGGGRGAFLIHDEDPSEVFDKLKKNFIVQRRIIQSDETAVFNPSSVNTEKVVSFMFKGEVHILSAIMRVGAEGSVTAAAASGKGYFFGIKDDGTAAGCGLNIFGKRRNDDYYGNPIKGRFVSHHSEICDIVKRAHRYFPYFGFMSWDFCVNNDDEVVLIEYNTGYPVALVYQMVTGPFLGDLTESVLADVRKKI